MAQLLHINFLLMLKKKQEQSNPPANFSWNKSSNLNFNGSANGASVSVTANSAGAGWVSVCYDGGVETDRKEMWVGLPVIDYITGSTSPNTNSYIDYSVYHVGRSYMGLSNCMYTWEFVDYVTYPYIYHRGFFGQIVFYDDGYYKLKITATNICGSSDSYLEIYVSNRSFTPVSHYPNPVSTTLTVDIDKQAMQAKSGSKLMVYDPTFNIRLSDSKGVIVRQTATKNTKTQFDVSSLSDG